MTLLVEAVGPLATIQDLGRPGHADVGVTEAGALDRGALRRANELVGNPAHTPGVEALLGGLVVRAETPCLSGRRDRHRHPGAARRHPG